MATPNVLAPARAWMSDGTITSRFLLQSIVAGGAAGMHLSEFRTGVVAYDLATSCDLRSLEKAALIVRAKGHAFPTPLGTLVNAGLRAPYRPEVSA